MCENLFETPKWKRYAELESKRIFFRLNNFEIKELENLREWKKNILD